ncbi:MAG: hypothetical protein MUE72_09235 [Chitinophagaceae bacterium]|nr:hypothetical protein [Chitinophagaceae bacterium]
MIQYNRFTLSNGLKVLVHEDGSTPMAVVNIMYNVGARDENPNQIMMSHYNVQVEKTMLIPPTI